MFPFAPWRRNVQVIDYINANPDRYDGARFHYSTLGEYMTAIHDDNATWPTYDGDFLPYTGMTCDSFRPRSLDLIFFCVCVFVCFFRPHALSLLRLKSLLLLH